MTSAIPAEPHFSFFSLPRELQYKILTHTNLVVHPHPDCLHSGLLIRDGVITPGFLPMDICTHTPKCDCCDKPDALLSPSNPELRPLALDILLSCNRIIVDGDFATSLKWLEKQGDAVRKIRQLDLQLGEEQVEEWHEHRDAWSTLVGFVKEHLALSNLELSVDHGVLYEYYEEGGYGDQSELITKMVPAYFDMAIPLRGFGQLGLKRFYAYFITKFEMETTVEQLVMGENYVAPGKIPHTHRSPCFPHGDPFERKCRQGMGLGIGWTAMGCGISNPSGWD